MLRLLLALSLLVATPACASLHGALRPACAFGFGYVNDQGVGDGCLQAEIAAAGWPPPVTARGQLSTFANYVVASGQSSRLSTHPMPWNVAGIDYPVGYSTTLPLVDVAQAKIGYGWGQIPPQCAYAANTTSTPTLTCKGAANKLVSRLEIHGLDFCGKKAGLHVGAQLVVSNYGMASNFDLEVHDNYFCVSSTATNAGLNASTNGVAMMLIEGGVPGTTWTRTYAHNTFDGGAEPWSTNCNGAPCTASPVRAISDSAYYGDRWIEYNEFLYTTGRPVTGSSMFGTAAQPLHLYLRYNYEEGMIAVHSADHGEVTEDITGPSAIVALDDVEFNVCAMGPWTPNNGITACFYPSAGTANGTTFQKVVYENNVTLGNNSVGGTAFGTTAAPDTNCHVTATGTLNGSTLTLTQALSAALGNSTYGVGCTSQGYVLVGAGVPANTVVQTSGVGPTFTVSPAISGSVGPEPVTFQFAVDNSASAAEISYTTYGTFIAHNNYMDPTGATGCFGAPDPFSYSHSFTGAVSPNGDGQSSTLTLASGSLPIFGQLLYAGGASTGFYLNTSFTVSGGLSEPAGTVMTAGGRTFVGYVVNNGATSTLTVTGGSMPSVGATLSVGGTSTGFTLSAQTTGAGAAFTVNGVLNEGANTAMQSNGVNFSGYVTPNGDGTTSTLTVTSGTLPPTGYGLSVKVGTTYTATGFNLTAQTTPASWTVSGVLTEPAGTSMGTDQFTLGSADFGSGDPAGGGTGNINLIDGSYVTGFVGNAFGYAAACNGKLP